MTRNLLAAAAALPLCVGAIAALAQDKTPAAPAAAAPATDAATDLRGKPAPAFALPDQNDKMHALGKDRGKWVVLAFYPKDMTAGCTLQNKSYSAHAGEFAAKKAVVYTVSTQDTKSKQDFCKAEGLTHLLLSDVGGKSAAAYGVLLPNGMARRVTFYIDPRGQVAHVDTTPRVGTAAEDSLATLTQLAEKRRPLGSDAKPVRTENTPGPLVGPASTKVTMDALVPDFGLPDVKTGKTVSLTGASAGKKATVILFVSTECPVSNAYNGRMARLAADYGAKGVAVLGINANSTESVSDAAAHADKNTLGFPVLKDANNQIADRFEAKVTPEAYVLDGKGVLVYHGAVDDAQNEGRIGNRYLAAALDAVLAGQPVSAKTSKAVGCGIKRAQK